MRKRVLFIDDQLEDWEGLLRRGLEPFGFELKGEEDPSKALRIIGSYRPDVVLLDILFPNGNRGKPTLEKIKKKYPNLPVIMITSTMKADEYRSEDYALADYRYAKAALTEGDCSDLAAELDRLIEKVKAKEEEKIDNNKKSRFGFIVGKTEPMQKVVETVEKVADQDHTVLITGETGTGKELIAKMIHFSSGRKRRPFVKVNCGAITESILESELFGHEIGAFTGAVKKKEGLFYQAQGGSILLDEVSEMSMAMQVKLLRVLQEKEITRVGGDEVIKVDARVIAATNKDLSKEIEESRFREDLYYRLYVISIHMPPLRERKEDISLFFEHFISEANAVSKKKVKVRTDLRGDVKKLLIAHPWPGNIRQLKNVIYNAVALAEENILQVKNFSEMNKEGQQDIGILPNNDIMCRIYQGELTWQYLKDEFAAKGETRKKVLLEIIDHWGDTHDRRPSQKELAELLSIKPGNVKRILSEYSIKLKLKE
jgi:DNA-binding NtrC family response regulator